MIKNNEDFEIIFGFDHVHLYGFTGQIYYLVSLIESKSIRFGHELV